MTLISTRNLSPLPNAAELRDLLRSMAMLDAILCPDCDGRYGNPLWFGETREGMYFGSLAGELPGLADPIPDERARLLVFNCGELRHGV